MQVPKRSPIHKISHVLCLYSGCSLCLESSLTHIYLINTHLTFLRRLRSLLWEAVLTSQVEMTTPYAFFSTPKAMPISRAVSAYLFYCTYLDVCLPPLVAASSGQGQLFPSLAKVINKCVRILSVSNFQEKTTIQHQHLPLLQ